MKTIISENHKYEFGCIMGILDRKTSKIITKLNNELIPNESLYNEPGEEYGREIQPHITIKFGLKHNYSKEAMGKVISHMNPFSAWLQKIDIFQNEKFDVVKFNVKGDELNRWNQVFSRLPNEDKHPEYHPHLTLAYVKPGMGKNFIKNIKPIQIYINKVKYSSPVGKYFYDLESETSTIQEDAEYNAGEDFYRRREEQLEDLAVLLKKSGGKGRVPWKTIPAKLLAKVWLQFGKYNRINTNDLDKIADQMLTNIARLKASTEMMGHESYDVRPELADMGYEFTDEEWEAWMADYFTDKEGSWMISDYGLPQLEKLYGPIFNAPTDEEKLYAIDKALNVVHQRSDLASMFVEGGIKTLNFIQNQGGYSSET